MPSRSVGVTRRTIGVASRKNSSALIESSSLTSSVLVKALMN